MRKKEILRPALAGLRTGSPKNTAWLHFDKSGIVEVDEQKVIIYAAF